MRRGKDVRQPVGLVEITVDRPGTAASDRAGRRITAGQRHYLMAAPCRLAQHVLAGEPTAAGDQQSHRRPPAVSMILRYSLASVVRSKHRSTWARPRFPISWRRSGSPASA